MNIKRKSKRKIFITTLLTMIIYILSLNEINALVKLDKNLKIQIIATSNLNGKFTAYEYSKNMNVDGGLTQISTLIKEEMDNNKNTVIIDNGDSIRGNYSNLFSEDKENPMILAMNKIGYDVLNLGEGELNLGIDKVNSFKNQSQNKVNIICSNLYKNGERVFDGYAIKELDNNIKVAIIGIVLPEIEKKYDNKLNGCTLKNPIDEVGIVIDEIKSKGGADLYILSANISVREEKNSDENLIRKIAERYDNISAIVIGDECEIEEVEKINNAIVIKPNSNGESIGKIEITLEKIDNEYKIVNEESEIIPTASVIEDEELTEEVKSYHERLVIDATKKIGVLDKDLVEKDNIKGIPQSIVSDQGLTDFINEVQLYYSRKQLEELDIDVDNIYHVSAANIFESTSNIEEGNITKADIYNIYGNDNNLSTIKITGKQLKKLMEWSVAIYNKFQEGDLTISLNEKRKIYQYYMFDGISYEINISNDINDRIENLIFEKDKKEVKDDDTVYLAINNLSSKSIIDSEINSVFHGESYEKICDTSNYRISAIRDLIFDYIINVNNGEIKRNVDENWKLTGVKYDNEKREVAMRLINEEKLKIMKSSDEKNPIIKSITWDDVIEVSDKTIDIIAFNDFHGSLQEGDKSIGAAKLLTLIKEKQSLKSDDYDSFIVSTGDVYGGAPISTLTYGKAVSEFLKEMDLTVSSIGIHEFDLGIDKIKAWQREGEFSFLAANIVDKESRNPISWIEPYSVIESNGLKIGVIGVTTPEIVSRIKDENIENLEFISPESVINKYAKKLKEEEKVNAVVVLGYLEAIQNKITDKVEGEVTELAKSIYNVDAIITGSNGKYISGSVNNIPIVEAGGNGEGLSNLKFTFNVEGKLLNVEGISEKICKTDEKIIANDNMERIIKSYEEELSDILLEKIAYLDRDLDYDKDNGLTYIGMVIAESLRRIANTDIVLIDGREITGGLEQGEVTVEDLYTIVPYDNELVTINLTGEEIKNIIEDKIKLNDNECVQFAGINVYYDESREIGKGVTSIKLTNGTSLDMNRSYKVLISDFMLSSKTENSVANNEEVMENNINIRNSIMELWKNEGINFEVENLLVVEESQCYNYINKDEKKYYSKGSIEESKGINEKLPITGGVNSIYIIISANIIMISGMCIKKKRLK
ncbi:5'-nucleotidase C-terminal domain-containing protein [Clostridium celatum]|uniref:5'-nucleotidase C-terminal domain-containing protein n=1 Tax=Clostridium celatum TaxID=36834 RepID=UPI00290A13BF|nr:5'-nucleotidase C-terminal domain-containing protein [Clostridium celatum]MDU6295278.1 5'-nucleotidase C-terminal domain-containing protein [Clostridium celatum]